MDAGTGREALAHRLGDENRLPHSLDRIFPMGAKTSGTLDLGGKPVTFARAPLSVLL